MNNFKNNTVNTTRILYTPSSFAKTSLLYLQEIGESTSLTPHKSKHNNISSLLFFTVTSGSGNLHYMDNVYHLKVGDCVLIDCNNSYYHESSDDLWTIKWIHFWGPTAQAIFLKYIDRGGLFAFKTKHYNSYLKLWDKLFNYASSLDYIRDMHINELLSNLLTTLMSENYNDAKVHKKVNATIQHVKEYIDNHYTEDISLDNLSSIFFINKSYLLRQFKSSYNITINTYINSLRITKAKYLLRFSDLSLTEIGEQCNITPTYYFSRTFKKFENMPPSEYRKKWR